MPLLIAPLVAVSLGMYFGLLRPGSLGAQGTDIARRCTALYMTVCFFPVIAFAALMKPAWAWLHVLGHGPISALNLMAAGGAAAFIGVGQIAGRSLGGLPRARALTVAAVPAIVSALLVIVMHRRFSVLEPASRSTEVSLLWGSRFAFGLLALLLLLALGTWLTAREIEALDADPDAAPEALGGPWGPLVAARRQTVPKARPGPARGTR